MDRESEKPKPSATTTGAGELTIPGLAKETTMTIPLGRQGQGFDKWLQGQKTRGATVTRGPDGTVTIILKK